MIMKDTFMSIHNMAYTPDNPRLSSYIHAASLRWSTMTITRSV